MKLYSEEQVIEYAKDYLLSTLDGRLDLLKLPNPAVELKIIGYFDEKFFNKHGTSIMNKTKGYELGGAVSDLQELFIVKFNNK